MIVNRFKSYFVNNDPPNQRVKATQSLTQNKKLKER